MYAMAGTAFAAYGRRQFRRTGTFSLILAALVGLLTVAFRGLSVSTLPSPQSVGSDLRIVTHNDLHGNDTTRQAAAVSISTPYSNSAAASRCAALGTTLWDPDGDDQDSGFLRYLDYGKHVREEGTYWIRSNSMRHCRAITTRGLLKSYACSTCLPALCTNTRSDTPRDIVVKTKGATIMGCRDRYSFRFLGLRYASIPARFQHSVYDPPASSMTAPQYGPKCIQAGCTSCSEDCLSLNIWIPYLPNGKSTDRRKKVVMVWIHGGGFASGTGSDTTFEGSALASRGDVVVVTINYRLGTLGFLALENTTLTGNYGLKNQSNSLDWLHTHIEDFGGDKNRITLFGQSAGAASIRALLASPEAREKNSGAIMMSTPQGMSYASTFSEYLLVSEATERAGAIVDEVGCLNDNEDVVACLSRVDPMQFAAPGRTIAT